MCTKDGSKKGTGNNTSGGQIRHDGVGNYSERATTQIMSSKRARTSLRGESVKRLQESMT